MSDTLFTCLTNKVSDANDTFPSESASFYMPPMDSVMNVSEKTMETIFLNNGDTRTVTLPQYAATDWVMLVARVIGHAKLNIVGVDFDGASAIASETAGYGTTRHPGYIAVTTINATSFVFEGLADTTMVQYLAVRAIPDSAL